MRIKRFNCASLPILVIASIVAMAIPPLSSSPGHAALTQHATIGINGNSGFKSPNPVNGGGSGRAGDPYIIENWVISASSANGIDIEGTTAYFIVRNCLIENGAGNRYVGIYLNTVINGKILNNICDNCLHGIDLGSNSNYIVLDSNTCFNNVGDGSCGIHLWHDSYDNVINNHCYNTYGRTDNVKSRGLDSYNGIGAYFTSNCIIKNNICENSSHTGIKVGQSSTYNNVINNICKNCYNGVYISDEGSVCNNLVSNNTCDYGKYGITLDNPTDDYNTLDNNTCKYNSYSGIFLDFPCSNNTIINNTCSSNLYGIYLTTANKNTITHNFLLKNTSNNAYDDGQNYWDDGYPSGGNYWSDFTGLDNYHGENQKVPGGDNIGDRAYRISGGSNLDRYPLMESWAPVELHLVVGWNLLSFSVVNENTTPNNVFTGLSYLSNYFIYWREAPSGPNHLQGPNELLKDNISYWVWIDRDWTVTLL